MSKHIELLSDAKFTVSHQDDLITREYIFDSHDMSERYEIIEFDVWQPVSKKFVYIDNDEQVYEFDSKEEALASLSKLVIWRSEEDA